MVFFWVLIKLASWESSHFIKTRKVQDAGPQNGHGMGVAHFRFLIQRTTNGKNNKKPVRIKTNCL